ncbi:hypothetical protein MHYP_G00220420 [Metynnis hypsauchen]
MEADTELRFDGDAQRAVHAPSRITDKVLEMFRSKSEFTFMASIQQKAATSGVLFSIHESEHSYFELESSGLREEIRYHYRHNGKPRSETFPYRLADGQWHKIALTISASHLLLHVDCNSNCGVKSNPVQWTEGRWWRDWHIDLDFRVIGVARGSEINRPFS